MRNYVRQSRNKLDLQHCSSRITTSIAVGQYVRYYAITGNYLVISGKLAAPVDRLERQWGQHYTHTPTYP